MTYSVAPRAEQRASAAETPDELPEKGPLTWNITGAMPSAAAIALGALAILTTGDLRHSERDGVTRAPVDPEPAGSGAATRVRVPAIPMVSPVDMGDGQAELASSSRRSPIVAPGVQAGGGWTAAAPSRRAEQPEPRPGTPSVARAAEPAGLALAGAPRDMTELGPLALESTAPPSPPSAALGTASLARDLQAIPSSAVTLNVRMELPPASTGRTATPEDRADLIRRDYSQTLGNTGASRDTPLSAQAAEEFAAATATPEFSGSPAAESVQLIGGELASIKLSEVLKLVEPQMDPDEYASLAGSAGASSYVSPEMMEEAGLAASFDAENFVLALSVAA